MSIEQRLEQVERQTKRLRVAVVVLAAALCGVVSMAATPWWETVEDIGPIDTLEVHEIRLLNKAKETVIHMSPDAWGHGTIWLSNANGADRILLGSQDGFNAQGGLLEIKDKNGTIKTRVAP